MDYVQYSPLLFSISYIAYISAFRAFIRPAASYPGLVVLDALATLRTGKNIACNALE